MKEVLNISLTINDIFNTQQSNFLVQTQQLYYTSVSKPDTRSFWLSVSYSFGMLSKFKKEKADYEIENTRLETDKQIIEKPKGLK
jgi:hypothetical protein